MVSDIFKPLLAPIDSPASNPNFFKLLRYPLLGSPKLDGIRALVPGANVLSRTGKLLPSYQVQDEFSRISFGDGEVVEGKETDGDVYNRTESHVMSRDRPGDLTYWLFDYIHPKYLLKPYHERLDFIETFFNDNPDPQVKVVKHEYIDSYEELIAYEEVVLGLGFEGVMLRDPVATYKNGRSTFREGILIKLKRFEDIEGMVIAFEPRMQNMNVQERDELGFAKRSQAKSGLVPTAQVGKFIVESKWGPLDVAPGKFNHEQLKYIWANQDRYLGKMLKFRFFAHGIKDKPRFPRAIGWRDKIDL